MFTLSDTYRPLEHNGAVDYVPNIRVVIIGCWPDVQLSFHINIESVISAGRDRVGGGGGEGARDGESAGKRGFVTRSHDMSIHFHNTSS